MSVKPNWLVTRIWGIVVVFAAGIVNGWLMAEQNDDKGAPAELYGPMVMFVPVIFLLLFAFSYGVGWLARRFEPSVVQSSWKGSPFSSRDIPTQMSWVGTGIVALGVGLAMGMMMRGNYGWIFVPFLVIPAGLSMCVAGRLVVPRPSVNPVPIDPHGGGMRGTVWLLKLFLVVSLCAIVGSGVWFVTRWRLLGSGVRAGAAVTRVVQGPNTGSHYVVRFEGSDSSKGTMEIQTSWSADPPVYRVGDRVEVVYPPGRPENALIVSFWGLWGAPSVVLAIAVVQALGCTGALWYLSRGDARGTETGSGNGDESG